MTTPPLKNIIEAVLLASTEPLTLERLQALFEGDTVPAREDIRRVLDELRESCTGRSMELKEVGSGFRYQVNQDYAPWVTRLWEDRPPRYSRALMETLALIAYRQPITRPEIEDVRGVGVSTQIMKTLQEREWVRVVGYRDVPGKPAMYGTTREFMDYFTIKSLDDLPKLAEIRDITEIQLDLGMALPQGIASNGQDD
jgi:segregation and condensation protein B